MHCGTDTAINFTVWGFFVWVLGFFRGVGLSSFYDL